MPRLPQNIRAPTLKALAHLRIMAAQAPAPSRPIKVLMIHGYTQSGPLFHAKTRALEKNLQKAFPAGISLHYPTGPFRLSPADVPFLVNPEGGEAKEEEIDAWAWWRRKGDGVPYVYDGLDAGIAQLAKTLKEEGPFDGAIGFSQGGAATAILASLLEHGRKEALEKVKVEGGIDFPASLLGPGNEMIHPPLKFAVSYSGFAPRDVVIYKGFYEPKIKTPLLHFLGSLDTVVEEKRSLALVDACEQSEGRVVYHPGGHFLPASQRAYVQALIGFMKEELHKADNAGKEEQEESVEDMDVPF